MQKARLNQSATVLPEGKVLISGRAGNPELFDPATGT
jgi:hypothetical protein